MSKTKTESVVLAKKLGIGEIEALSEQLVPLLIAADEKITVNANEVESIDIAALQVLVAFSNSAARRSKTVHWTCSEGVVKEMAELCDLDRHLTLDTESEVIEDDGLCPVF